MVINIKTIKYDVKNTLIINKSTFITLTIKVDSVTNIKEIIEKLKTEYKDATHYCFGYIIGNDMSFNDDGEPKGTAGFPILDILKKKKLNNVLCVVIRYFGGVKLGANGLVRAYRKSALEAFNNALIVDLIEGYFLRIEESYDKQREIEKLIDNYSKEYKEYIIYSIYCDNNTYKKLLKYNVIEERKEIIEK